MKDAPDLDVLMELIAGKDWQIETKIMGPQTVYLLKVPGQTHAMVSPLVEPLNALKLAHEAEIEAYRLRLFAVLAMFEDEMLARCIAERDADFQRWATRLTASMGQILRQVALDAPAACAQALRERGMG